MFKRGGYYYHTMAASGGIYNGHHQLIARSTNVLGPFEFSPHNPFIAQLDTNAPCQHQGHAKLVETQNGEWWAVYLLQRRIKGFSQLGRETGLDRVDWLADGWPVLNGGKGPSATNAVPKLPITLQPNEPGDEFAARQLGVQWQFVRNPDYPNFSLTERKGWLRIYGGEFDVDSTNARNVILQRETSQHYTATTKLEFDPKAGAQAGLLCYYDTKTYIKFALAGQGGRRLLLEECRKGVKKTLAESPVNRSKAIFLRVRVAGLSRCFEYSLDGKQWHEAGAVADASFLSDQGTPQWGFMGTMVGVFALNPDVSAKVAADFDWFRFNQETK
jgi:xylan 1,4-beta-xylosidase